MKTMLSFLALTSLLTLAVPVTAYGQCQGDPTRFVVPDGQPKTFLILANATVVNVAALTAGRSYSLQIETGEGFATLTNPPLVHCDGPASTIRDTSLIDPQLINSFGDVAGGRRISILPSATGLYGFDFTNNQEFEPLNFTAVLVETTLYNPAWSTFGTFETFYSCINTTRGALSATLKFFTIGGAPLGSFAFNDVAEDSGFSTNTGALGIVNNQSGFATLTHDGPPGAFKCEAAIADFATAPRVIQPVKFETARQMR